MGGQRDQAAGVGPAPGTPGRRPPTGGGPLPLKASRAFSGDHRTGHPASMAPATGGVRRSGAGRGARCPAKGPNVPPCLQSICPGSLALPFLLLDGGRLKRSLPSLEQDDRPRNAPPRQKGRVRRSRKRTFGGAVMGGLRTLVGSGFAAKVAGQVEAKKLNLSPVRPNGFRPVTDCDDLALNLFAIRRVGA